MKTKLIVNSALSVLVALGIAACSSGGGSASADLKKSVDKVKQEVKKPADKVKEDAKGELKKPVEKVEEKAKNVVEKAKEETKPIAEKVTDEVKPAVEKAREEAKPIAEKVTDEVKPAVEKAKEEAKPIAEKVTDEVKPAVEKAKEETKPIAEKVTDEVKPAVEKAREEAKPIAEKVTDEVKPAVEKVKEETKPVDTAKDELKQLAENKAESQILDEQPGIYASLTALNNEKLDVTKLSELVKENINYSSAGQLRIASDDGKYGTSNDAILFLASEDYQMLMTATNPNVSGWKYQTIAQVTDYSANEEGALGFISIGEKSKVSAIPTKGSVTYQGKVIGRSLLQHNDLNKGTVQSDVTVDVDFSAKAVILKTQNTKLRNADTPALDLTGSATLDSTKNALVEGKIYLTQTPEHKGELKGALFGPKAEEVGGTFNIEGGQFIGGFGATQ